MKQLFVFSFLFLLVAGCQPEMQFSDKMKVKILDDIKRDDITGRIHMLFREIDNQNWEQVKEILAKEVELDMGKGPKKMTADEVIALWKTDTKNLDGVHHQVSNYGIEVNDQKAKLSFLGTATHYKKLKSKKSVKTLYGNYEVQMVHPGDEETNWAWKVTHFSYKNKFTVSK